MLQNTQRLTKQIFAGDASSPLLAPRGVYMHDSTLVVSDTGQNRVCIWNDFRSDRHQPVDIVLGQSAIQETGRNAGAEVHAASLQYPSGVWTNGQILILADAWNHRVLIWRQMPSRHGQPADVVVGQPDFSSNQPNVGGLLQKPSEKSLYWPYGVWSNGHELWIADTGNRRVLYYDQVPAHSFAAATAVIGQASMLEKEYNPDYAIWPYSVKVSPQGAMLITDTQYNRALLWTHWTNGLARPADIIIGQKDLQQNGQNQYGLTPQAHTLNWCYDACFLVKGVAIADTGNSRIMAWNTQPELSGMPADWLLGQSDFTVNGESSLSMKTGGITEMYWPFAINYCEASLLVADTGNHHILIYKNVTI